MTLREVAQVTTVVLLAACGSEHSITTPPPPPPPGIDPSVLVVNLSGQSIDVIFATDTGRAVIAVPPETTVCTAWLQQFDSLYTWIGDPSDSSPHAAFPWLHFADYPYYFQVDTVWGQNNQQPIPGGDATSISQHIAASECSP